VLKGEVRKRKGQDSSMSNISGAVIQPGEQWVATRKLGGGAVEPVGLDPTWGARRAEGETGGPR